MFVICKSTNICIVFGGYLCILGVHSVQSCCMLWISTFYHYLFVVDIANPDLLRVVVGPALVSTSTAFTQKHAKLCGYFWGGKCRHNLHSGLPDCCGSTTCRLCRLEIFFSILCRAHPVPLQSCSLLVIRWGTDLDAHIIRVDAAPYLFYHGLVHNLCICEKIISCLREVSG